MKRIYNGLLAAIVSLPAWAQAPAPTLSAAPLVAPFSAASPGPPQAPWTPVKITDRKKPTRYELVDNGGTTVLHAVANAAASVLAVSTRFDPHAAPVIAWRWKIDRLISAADPAVASREDSPARIVLEFDGDKSKLSVLERSLMAVGERNAGRELPYATLIYIWANTAPVDTVIANPHTSRVQMVVASSGATGVGAWQALSRNIVADYKRAFHEEPGRLTGVGVLTDTDNTGERVEAWYGDIRFLPASP